MKQVQCVVTIALALLLIGVPAVSLAQTPSSPAAGSSDKAKDKPAAPSASPSTSGSSDTGAKTDSGSSAGQASPMAPASAEDCKKDGWQKLGFKTEAECAAKVKK